MTSVTCIIQARRQSTRLPDKILKPLGGKAVLQHVIERCKQIEGVKTIIVASPDDHFEDQVEAIAIENHVHSYRGSMTDVLGRYHGAAQMTDCAYIMRVTADCPLLDPALCSQITELTISENADYGGIDGWPHGLDCEIFKRSALEKANAVARNPLDREHVTLWMKRQNNLKKTFLTSGENTLHTQNRWVVDYHEDYVFLEKLFSLFPSGNPAMSWEEIIEIVNANEELRSINNAQAIEWAEKNIEIHKGSALEND